VLAGPYRRARETAELLVALAPPEGPEMEIHDDLAADAGAPHGLVRALAAEGQDALLIGHQPYVEDLVRALVHPAPVPLPAGFRTAIIVALEFGPAGRWHFSSLVDPHLS
jgi:phosphohistidine phosphatase